MLFNSIEYLLFFPFIFLLYWSLSERLKSQNILLLIASYFFYGLWDYRFLSLILISTVVDFSVGHQLKVREKQWHRNALLGISLLVNLGLLFVFKYFNFFLDSFVDFSSLFGLQANVPSLQIILPVGISFYTFQTMSYTIDVYRKRLSPTSNFLNFSVFVAFFPQLVAGPIERASNLLPQIERKRFFRSQDAKDGLRQILWGLFKKVAIADNCAMLVNPIFNGYEEFSSFYLLLGAILFSVQIYGDFSGYSDIAIGSARLLGVNLKQNFATPYFARDNAEFWRRWHMSLTTWIRDYIYFPLGGSRLGNSKRFRNTILIFVLIGLWHGANWTFVFYGFIHSLFFIPHIFFKQKTHKNPIAENRILPSTIEFFLILKTFVLISLIRIFFRSPTIGDAFTYIGSIFNLHQIQFSKFISLTGSNINDLFLLTFFIFTGILIEWFNRNYQHGLERLPSNRIIRTSLYLVLSIAVLEYLNGQVDFIYFQF